MKREIVITGMGCITPLGNDPETMWENIISGNSGIGPITRFDASNFKTRFAGEIKNFDPIEYFGRDTRRMDPFTQYAVYSARQAVQQANLQINDENRNRIGAVIGSGVGGINTIRDNYNLYADRGPERVSPFLIPMMIPDAAGAQIAIDLGIRGPNMAISTACATGTNAIGEAAEVIRRGHADVMFAGAAEAGLIEIAIAGMINITALSTNNEDPQGASRPFDLKRDGFVTSEGAAVLVLESLEHAQERGAKIYARISGYGITNDAYHIAAPAEDGEGASRCMRMALESANLLPGDIDYINAHGTSTVLNDKTETLAVKNLFGETAYSIPISSTKSMHGHLLGASGALEAVICVYTLMHKLLPPTINYEFPDPECDLDYVPNHARPVEKLNHIMSNSFGFGGHNATIIISRENGNEQ
jgi:3-oxoacyl-[acyl-carrier-protein] synthase II